MDSKSKHSKRSSRRLSKSSASSSDSADSDGVVESKRMSRRRSMKQSKLRSLSPTSCMKRRSHRREHRRGPVSCLDNDEESHFEELLSEIIVRLESDDGSNYAEIASAEISNIEHLLSNRSLHRRNCKPEEGHHEVIQSIRGLATYQSLSSKSTVRHKLDDILDSVTENLENGLSLN